MGFSRSYRHFAQLVAATAIIVSMVACGSERDAIDRTQPNILTKDMFQGEWYFGQTVVDLVAGENPTFTGYQNSLERVRFDIQEEWLYVRRSYERIKNGDIVASQTTSPDDGGVYMGEIIAAYKIQKHFDIQRAYNSTTGEEHNVVEENAVDRPWYEREYMRVDWSINHAKNFNLLLEDTHQEPVAYYVQDANDPDFPVIDAGEFDDDGTMVRAPYLDITNVIMATPGSTYIPEMDESYPTCWFFSHATQSCGTASIKIRNSFQRIDPKREYQGKAHVGPITEYYGFFWTERMVYNPDEDLNWKNLIQFGNFHNIFKKWYAADGSVLPSEEREARPIVYYAVNWPERLWPTLRSVEQGWNKHFQRAFSAALETEYTATAFKVCSNPVSAEDAGELCGDEGFTVRAGDIRYHKVVFHPKLLKGWVPLGYGPSFADPLTGEIISGVANMYSSNDYYVQLVTDQMQLINGDMDPTSYIDGVDLTWWWKQADEKKKAENRGVVGPDQIQAYMANQNYDWVAEMNGSGGLSDTQASWLEGKRLHEVWNQLAGHVYDRGAFNGEMDTSQGRMQNLTGTYIEQLMANDEMRLLAGVDPSTPFNSLGDEIKKKISMARMGPIETLAAMARFEDRIIQKHSIDAFAIADIGYHGLAEQLKGLTQEEMKPIITDKVYHGVVAHELGHTFGLMHNFGASEDVLNYEQEYWDLRTADGTVGPRWLDPITDAELDGGIHNHATSTVMDYSRLTMDYAPGKYDSAALLYAYGDKVEVFKTTSGIADKSVFHDWSDSRGQILMFLRDTVTGRIVPRSFHYTEWFNKMGEKAFAPSNRKEVSASTVDWSTHKTMDKGDIVVPYIYCSDYSADIGNSCFRFDYGADEYERVQHHIEMANTWYIQRAFTRYRIGADPNNYIGRTYSRTYQRLKGYNDYYVLMNGILRDILDKDDVDAFMTGSTDGWGGYTAAVGQSLNFLLTTITQPNVTGFEVRDDGTGKEFYREAQLFGGPETDVSNGRYFTTSWNATDFSRECGLNWWRCLHHYGFYLDKVMALNALSDAQTYFVARDTSEDIRQWRISFYDNYSEVLNGFFGSILAHDYDAYAPRVVGQESTSDGQRLVTVHPDYAGCPAGTCTPLSNTMAIDPATGFSVQLYAAVLGMARFQNNFDRTFLDSTNMWIAGGVSEVDTVQPPAEFIDPDTGKKYRAIDRPNFVAKRMIDRANVLKARSVDGSLEAADRQHAAFELERYKDTLDILVDLTGYYGTYSSGYGDPYNPGGLP